ncbi:site-specific integrase [Clostridium beijerinckii]|uniref:site-specific integrase n=1 Tax=Clostridium beijerinckii TaxID=1520 RepID=UPI001570F380|nr:site-specific integrase [Clostridium beijerinckii]NRT75528.1 site-specific recombinase XerD [Clostridium beijerinckii]
MSHFNDTIYNNITNYINTLKIERNLSEKSIKAYYSDLSSFSIWLKNSDSDIIELDLINLYISWLQNTKQLKDTSIKRKYVTLKSFFKFLLTKKLIEFSPFENMRISFKTTKNFQKHYPLRI